MKEWLKMNFNINIPTNANTLIHLLQKSGYSAYIVGGCVRDSILGRNPNDWDICTSATPNEMLNIFKDYQIIETGLKHGTITVLINAEAYEVTTFRIDGEYSDNRRPDNVIFTDKLIEDLSRRDFTINAIAYNDEEGLIDPFGGAEDISNRLIKCVGDASIRFSEDALRVLRALRFACQLGFAIEISTSIAILNKATLLKNISKERINTEFCKMLCTEHFWNIALLYEGVFCQFIPELCELMEFGRTSEQDRSVWRLTMNALRNSNSKNLAIRLAIFFHGFKSVFADGEMTVDNIMSSLRFDNKTRHDVAELVRYHDNPIEPEPVDVKLWLNLLGPDQFKRLLEIKQTIIKGYGWEAEQLEKIQLINDLLNSILENNECYSLKQLSINGDNLIELGYRPGKNIGHILTSLLQLSIKDNSFNNKENLLNYVLTNYIDKERIYI